MNRAYVFRIIISLAFFVCLGRGAFSAEKVLFDFEDDGKWSVPEWCWDKSDYVCKSAEISSKFTNHGQKSLKLAVDFPGNIWRAAVAECGDCAFDWSDYGKLSCDFYLPESAPYGLRAKLIITVLIGEDWVWTESAQTVDLVPGKWVTLSADLKPGSKDWMQFMSADSDSFDPRVAGAYIVGVKDDFRKNVKKIAVRIETDKSPYKGYVYIDNIRVE